MMDLETLSRQVSDLDKRVAVRDETISNHLERDDERFDTIVRGLSDLNTKMETLMVRVDKGVTRTHDRIDAEVKVRTAAITALQKGQLNIRIWVLASALLVTGGIATYFLQDRMEDAKRRSYPSAVSNAQAGEYTQD